MKLKENTNLADFICKVKECRSAVTFHSAEGDILALQSALCQYIFASLQTHPELLKDSLIVCENEADYAVLKDYIKA